MISDTWWWMFIDSHRSIHEMVTPSNLWNHVCYISMKWCMLQMIFTWLFLDDSSLHPHRRRSEARPTVYHKEGLLMQMLDLVLNPSLKSLMDVLHWNCWWMDVLLNPILHNLVNGCKAMLWYEKVNGCMSLIFDICKSLICLSIHAYGSMLKDPCLLIHA